MHLNYLRNQHDLLYPTLYSKLVDPPLSIRYDQSFPNSKMKVNSKKPLKISGYKGQFRQIYTTNI